jgi:hypothetical protein
MNNVWNLSKVLMRFIDTLREMKVIKHTTRSQCHTLQLVNHYDWSSWLKAFVSHDFCNAAYHWKSVTCGTKEIDIQKCYVSVAVAYMSVCFRQKFIILNSIKQFLLIFYCSWRFCVRINFIQISYQIRLGIR